jgi:hypothetical protein
MGFIQHITKGRELTEERLTLLLTSFPDYLEYVYSNIDLPSPTPLQHRIAEIVGENPDRLILEAARGTGKSWIAAIYTTWRLLRDKDEKVLVVSASGPKAIEIASFIRRLFIDVPLLNHLEPRGEDRDSVMAFDVSGCKTAIAPSVAVSGIGGQLTGRRASLVLADDVEVPSNSMTEMMREKLIAKTREFEALLIPDMPSSIIYLGTPQSMESIYNKLEYRTVILPAEVPEDETIYEGKLDPWILEQGVVGEATDKVRFPKDVLLQRKAGYGLAGYKLQYMLDCSLSDAERYPLKLRDLVVTSIDKDEAPLSITYTGSMEYVIKEIATLGFTGDVYHRPLKMSDRYEKYDTKIMAVDPSGSGADETTWCVLGVKNGFVYVLDVGGTQKGYSDEALVILSNKAREYKVNSVVLERNWGGGMFTNLFEKVLVSIYPCTIDEVVSKGQKEVRIIDSIEPLSSNHKLVFSYELLSKDAEDAQKHVDRLQYSLMYQYTHITREKGCLPHDDRLDALAMACEYIKDMILVDTDETIKRLEEAEMERWLYEKIYGGYSKKNPNYIDAF